jgi:cell division protein FtsB
VEQPKVVKLPKAKLPKAVKLPKAKLPKVVKLPKEEKAKLPKVVKLPKEEKAKLSIEIKKLEYLYSGSDRDDLEKAIKIDLNYTKDEELIYNNQSSCNKQIFLLKF